MAPLFLKRLRTSSAWGGRAFLCTKGNLEVGGFQTEARLLREEEEAEGTFAEETLAEALMAGIVLLVIAMIKTVRAATLCNSNMYCEKKRGGAPGGPRRGAPPQNDGPARGLRVDGEGFRVSGTRVQRAGGGGCRRVAGRVALAPLAGVRRADVLSAAATPTTSRASRERFFSRESPGGRRGWDAHSAGGPRGGALLPNI